MGAPGMTFDYIGVLYCETLTRRYFPGMRACVTALSNSSGQTTFETVQLASVSPGAGGILGTGRDGAAYYGGLFNAYPPGSRVYPLMECRPNLRITSSVVTDDKMTYSLEATESVGLTALPA